MKTSKIALAIAAFGLSVAGAEAACSPTASYDPVTGTLTTDVADCHLVINNPPIIPIVTGPVTPGDPAPGPGGVEVLVRNSATGEVGSDGGVIVDTINANTHYFVQYNAAQDAVLVGHEARLNDHDVVLANHENRIGGLEGDVVRLNGRVDQAFEGVAMALAMESPQVDPGKTFGISLNYGNFEGEGAFAAAAKLRFDETFAGTAGVGYGQSGTVGFRAGVQAQW